MGRPPNNLTPVLSLLMEVIPGLLGVYQPLLHHFLLSLLGQRAGSKGPWRFIWGSMSEMYQGQNHGAVCKQFSEALVAGAKD